LIGCVVYSTVMIWCWGYWHVAWCCVWSPDDIDDEDEDISPEAKAQREKIRRQQNNARER